MGGVAYVFPGQGAQYVGMGVDLAEAFPRARALFQRCLLYTSEAADE